MKTKEVTSYIASGLGLGTGASLYNVVNIPVESILNIILMVLSITSVIITTTIVVIGKIKEAKKDGVVTLDEALDIAVSAKDGVDKVKEAVTSKKEGK